MRLKSSHCALYKHERRWENEKHMCVHAYKKIKAKILSNKIAQNSKSRRCKQNFQFPLFCFIHSRKYLNKKMTTNLWTKFSICRNEKIFIDFTISSCVCVCDECFWLFRFQLQTLLLLLLLQNFKCEMRWKNCFT